MKINCQSCEAKYTIADEKVRGKTVKIRCKKCGAAIVVKGNEPPADHGYEDEEDDATRVYAGGPVSGPTTSMDWTLNMPDGEQRAVSVDEIAQLFSSGAINGDTYAWRDGMSDWLPLSQIVELAPALSPQAAPAPRPSTAPSPDPRLAGFAGESGGQARVAARRQERARDQDLFGGARKAGSDEDVAARAAAAPAAMPQPKHTFTAERGENSVLFSVDAIRATAKPQSKTPPPNDDDKVDFNALASNIPPPMDAPVGGFDEVLNSPPSFPGFGGPMLAAPMLPTTIEPEPPPPPDPAVAAAEVMPAKSNKGLVIGLVAGVLLLAVISLAFGGYVLFSRSEPAETPPAASSATTAAAPEASAPAPEATDTAAADAAAEEPKKDESADAGAAEPAATGTSTAKVEPKDPRPESTKKDEPKKDDKKDAKKDEPKDDKKDAPPAADTATPAAGGAPFSRSAAVSALNAAAGAASGCKKADGPTGRGRVSVTFSPSGRVTSAVVNGPPFAGTSVGGCVAAAFRRASVPPFTGSPVTVHKSFTIQ